MSPVAICTDSSALFPAGVAEQLGLIVVPITITLDGRTYEPDQEVDAFYERLNGGARVTTSQPSPGAFLEAYTGAAAAGAEEMLSIHLDARVSGTAGSAALAAREAPIPVTVVDVPTVSFGVGVCVRAAADAILSGGSARGAASAASRAGTRLRNAFVTHGGTAGRLPDTAGWSVLEFERGRARPLGVRDDVGQAIEAMVARVFDEDGHVRVAVGHAGASIEPAADTLALSLASLSHVVGVERYRVAPAVGAHTGGSSFGAFWWPQWQ